jgi:hypothetical protein
MGASMNMFARSLVIVLVASLGITNSAVIFGAQPPQRPEKHNLEGDGKEASTSKKPKVEEQKDDSGREEKMDLEEYRQLEAAQNGTSIPSEFAEKKDSADDQDDSAVDDDAEEDDETRFSTPAVDAVADEISDLVIARYCAAPHTYNPDEVATRLTTDVEKILNERHIRYESDDLDSFHDMIDASLKDYVMPHFADFWQLSLLCNNQLSSYATPGEIAAALEESHQTAGNFDEEGLRQIIQRHRDAMQDEVREACTITILDALEQMALTNNHCSVLSHISPWYKKLFGVDADGNRQRDEHGQLIINREAVAHLVGYDTEFIQNFITLYGDTTQRGALIFKTHNIPLSQNYRKLQCMFGDLRYRLHKFTESLVLKFDSGRPSPVRNYYFDIIANYASQNQRDNTKGLNSLLALRTALGLERISQPEYIRIFECYTIGALCSQVMQNFNAAFFDNTPEDLIQKFVQQTMEFEILYGGVADESLIQDLHQKKEKILSMVKNIKTNTFRAYSKSLHGVGALQQIQVRRDYIDTSEVLHRYRGRPEDVCAIFDTGSDELFVNPVTITNVLQPDGFDHSGINRTMNTLLAQSFLGNVFFSPEGGYVVPKPLCEIRPPEGFGHANQGFVNYVTAGTFRALGKWLSIVFLNDIAVPLPLPAVFYAAVASRLPKDDHAAMLMWAEYLKAFIPETFHSYRDLLRKLLYGTLDELSEYCRDILGWSAAECAEILEQNKCNKILEAVILPKLNLVDTSSYKNIGNRFFGGFQVFNFTDHHLFNSAFNGMKLESAVTEGFLYHWFYSDSIYAAKKFLKTFFRWLSPYDLEHFFPSSIDADALLHSLVFNRNDLGSDQALLHVADVFEQALREYIQENRENQEKLQKLVNYFTGSLVYTGQPLTVLFAIDQTYTERVSTCFSRVDFNLRVVDTSNQILTDHVHDCQTVGDESFKATMKLLIASWNGQGLFSHEHQ